METSPSGEISPENEFLVDGVMGLYTLLENHEVEAGISDDAVEQRLQMVQRASAAENN